MARLYGRDVTRAELGALTGGPRALAGVRLVEYADGAERGLRSLQFRTGGGLEFDVLVDRACDIGEARLHGVPFAWSSVTGSTPPGLYRAEEEAGLGFLRGFSGLLTTCGLDHILGPADVDGRGFRYPRRHRLNQPLHGRISNQPARLVGYGERWDGDEGVLYAEGEIVQAAVFAEQLTLRRRITAPIGGTSLVIEDEVTNTGFADTPHMMLYHVDLGFPLLDEGAVLVAPVEAVLWASHEREPGLNTQGVGWSSVPRPTWPFVEQVWEHRLRLDEAGHANVMLVNARLMEGEGLGVRVAARASALPATFVWQSFAKGIYALGIEPATNHADGRPGAEAHGELVRLAAGDTCRHRLELAAFTGAALEAERARLEALQPGSSEDFPRVLGLPGR